MRDLIIKIFSPLIYFRKSNKNILMVAETHGM